MRYLCSKRKQHILNKQKENLSILTKRKGVDTISICFQLTDTYGGEESGGNVWRQAVLKGRLQNVIGEGERDDSQRGWIHDEHSAP